MDRNRRSFLKKAGRTALGLGCGLPLLSSGCSTVRDPRDEQSSAHDWAMIIDIREPLPDDVLQAAADACHLEHKVPFVHLPDDKKTVDLKREIKWVWKEEFRRAFPDQVHQRTRPATKEMQVPVLCNHCSRPSCTKVCPTGATWKRESDGLVMMDMHRCIGCRYCMAACPYGARSFNWHDPRKYPTQGENSPLLPDDPDHSEDYPTRGKGVVEKCTFCAERIRAAGKDGRPTPACVMAANQQQPGVMAFGRLGDEKIKQTLEANHTICRKLSLGTGPNVYYIVSGPGIET